MLLRIFVLRSNECCACSNDRCGDVELHDDDTMKTDNSLFYILFLPQLHTHLLPLQQFSKAKDSVSAFAAAFLSQLKFFCLKTSRGLVSLGTSLPRERGLISGWRFATSGVTILMKNPKNLATYCCTANHTVLARPKTSRQNLWGSGGRIRSFPPNCDDGEIEPAFFGI